MSSRFLKTTILTAAIAAVWTEKPRLSVPLNIKRRLSLTCWFQGHDDWIRRAPDRMYLECFQCGRETQGWTIQGDREAERHPGVAVQTAPMNTRIEQPSPAEARMATRQAERSELSTDHGGDMTIAA